MATKRSGFGHVLFGIFLAMFVYFGRLPLFNSAVNVIFNYSVVSYANYAVSLLVAAPLLFIACRKRVPAVIFSLIVLAGVVGSVAMAINETDTLYFDPTAIATAGLFALFMLIGSFLTGRGAKGFGVVILIIGIITAIGSFGLSLMDADGNMIGMQMWAESIEFYFNGFFQLANQPMYGYSTMLMRLPFSVSLSFLTLAAALLAPGKETAAPAAAPNVIYVDANGVPIQPGYNGMQQGYNPNMPQQGYNPNAPQQGYNTYIPNQGYSPNAPQQGYSQPAPAQTAYNPAPAQQPANPAPVQQPVNPAPAPQPAASDEPIDVNAELKKLSRLRDSGAITEAEFNAKKSEILSRL